MRKPLILLIPVDYKNAEAVADLISSREFANYADVKQHLKDKLECEEGDEDEIEEAQIYTLAEFMGEANNGSDVLVGYYLSYVYTSV